MTLSKKEFVLVLGALRDLYYLGKPEFFGPKTDNEYAELMAKLTTEFQERFGADINKCEATIVE